MEPLISIPLSQFMTIYKALMLNCTAVEDSEVEEGLILEADAWVLVRLLAEQHGLTDLPVAAVPSTSDPLA